MLVGGHIEAPVAPPTPVTIGSLSMDEPAFQHWVDLLEQRTGMVVAPQRRIFLETNLRMRMRELGMASFEHYRNECLMGPQGAMEWAVLVDRLTVHETHFFRHWPSLGLVRDVILPEFAAQRPPGAAFHGWSVGCSTGEEVFSLAMVIDEFASAVEPPFRFGLTGSDISQPALGVGKAGAYDLAKLDEIPPSYRRRYCDIGPDRFHLSERLRQRIGFAVLNLLEIERQPMTQLDLIYCQNVLIYFPRDRRESLLHQMVHCLRPGGALVLGPGEATRWSHPAVERFEHQRTLAYRRKPEEREQ